MQHHNHQGQLLIGRVTEGEGGRCQLLPCLDDTPKEQWGWSLLWHRQAYGSQMWPRCIPAPEIQSLFHEYQGQTGNLLSSPNVRGFRQASNILGSGPCFLHPLCLLQ